jgi:23S rRNA (cytosine1962-C5)-methyltransferase
MQISTRKPARGQVQNLRPILEKTIAFRVVPDGVVTFTSNMPTVKISTRGAKRVRHGHLWVYRSDIRDAGDTEGGAIVRVVDDAGNFVGHAFYSDASEIAVRVLTTRDETIDDEWWRTRLRKCAARRATIARETNAYRLVYSEGDLLSSLIVDVYNGHFVLQTLSQGTDRLQAKLVELLIDEFKPESVSERNDARVRDLEGLQLRTGIIWSAAAESRFDRDDDGALDKIEINQHGTRFLVSPLAAQKTGAFLDQRENYLAAKAIARGRALDCFTFNGGFALHIAPQCESVLGIDISSDAIAAAERNARLNELDKVQFRWANVFDLLRELEAAGERYDTIILDPPAFTKSRATIKSGARGYKEINLRALKLLNRGGVLITCTCSYHISEQLFVEIIADAALDARRRLQIVEQRSQSTDHPVLLGVPETHYLKCVIARAVD